MDKNGILDELENEYKKIFNEFGKKNNLLKEVNKIFIQSFDSLFKSINNLKSLQNKQLENALKNK